MTESYEFGDFSFKTPNLEVFEQEGASRMVECQLDKNKVRCTCTYEPCDRKGRCCECIAYHWRMKQLPGCFFSPEGERSYDRSIRRFVAENKL